MRAVIAPKVGAVQNIGEAASLAAVSQTFMFSSVSSVAGFSGHANYCAANAAVDALASNDAGRGLPSMAVQWGAWASVGMAADKHAMSAAQAEALGMLSPAAGVAAMERLLRGATAGLTAGVRGAAAPAYWRLLLQGVKHKPAMFSAVLDSAIEKDNEPVEAKVDAKAVVKKGLPSLAELEAGILSVVHDLMGPDVAPDAPLSSQGLDSLAAMELRQKLQARLGLELTALIEDPGNASVQRLAQEARAKMAAGEGGSGSSAAAAQERSIWISPTPVSVKMRLFCLPYAGGVSENVFARWAMMLPPSIQVCPIEIPGRGRREGEPSINEISELANILAHALPLQDKPYVLFGTCLGAITAYEIARVVEREQLAPMPVALYAAAVSPPHLYAYAVMKLYMTRQLEPDEPPPFEEVMEKLRGWDKLPKETLMLVFEKGNFAGLEEMKKNERLFNKVAPMGVNDIMMAVQYRHTPLPPLNLPITSFDGVLDGTIDRGNMEQWAQYTSAKSVNVPIQGDHYFVSKLYREVTKVIARDLLDFMETAGTGGILGEGHSWVGSAQLASALPDPQVVFEETGGEEGEHMHLDPETLEAEIRGMVAGYVGEDVDVSMPLAAQGLDSLAAMELRQKLQDRLGVTLTVLIEDPEGATIRKLVAEAMASGMAGGADGAARSAMSRGSLWISPSPVSVKLRLFCLPYAGGISENVFARWAMMLPPSIQVCPIEVPGRGRREGEPYINQISELATALAHSLPLQGKPYALFGTCLGAITAYEMARVVEREKNAPMPVALFAAAVSPPHLYAYAVMKLYMTRQLAADEPPPFEEVMEKLRCWDKLPKETLMLVFEKGNFAGLEEMKKNERLFNKVAPMGVNDTMMAVQYRHTPLPPLNVPITSFDGVLDGTIDRGNMGQWGQYTSAAFVNVPIQGDHYFVSKLYREVVSVVTEQLLDIIDGFHGGIMGEDHTWV
ncbi:g6282 [Coccomyxa elongata]